MENYDSAEFEFAPEFEFESEFEFEGEFETEYSDEAFTESELMELAGELLQVNSEAELDQFLGSLIKKAARKVRRAVRSPMGRALGGYLKGIAKRALPLAGTAVGGYFGGPLGAKIGRGLATAGGRMLGLEAEMMNGEDQEFEGAKQFSRLAGEAVKAALASPSNVHPTSAVQQAIKVAASKHAPGLVGGLHQPSHSLPGGSSGRWVRKGRNVVLLNC